MRWGTTRHHILLAGMALTVGVALALLPPPAALALVVGAVLVVLVAIEPLAGLAIMLGLGPLKTLIETEAALPLDVGQIALILTGGAWLAHKAAFVTGSWQSVALPGVFLPLLLYLFVAALSVIDAPDAGAGFRELLKWGEIALVAALTVSLVRGDRRRLRLVAWAVVGAGTAHAIIGIYEFFGGSGADHLAILDGMRYRAFGTFGQPNPFAGFLGLCLTVTLGAAWGALREKNASFVLYALAAGVMAGGLLASWSRGAWMGVAGGGTAMALFLPRRLRQGLLLVGGLMLVFALMWASGKLPGAIVERITDFTDLARAFDDVRGVDITDANYAEIERFAHWQAALGMAQEQPWLGVGFGNYAAAYPDHALMNWPDALGHAHNYYLNALAETGLLGLGAYLLFWLSVFGETVRVLRRPALSAWSRGAALGLLGAWTHLTIHSLLDKLYVNNIFLHLGVLLGILVVLRAEETRVSSLQQDQEESI